MIEEKPLIRFEDKRDSRNYFLGRVINAESNDDSAVITWKIHRFSFEVESNELGKCIVSHKHLEDEAYVLFSQQWKR